MKLLLNSIFSLVLSLLICTAYCQVANGGIIDLREVGEDFSWTDLDGTWYLHWNELTLAENIPSETPLVDFPLIWNLEAETGFRSQGYATYQVMVLLDPTRDYAISTPAVYSSYQFFINGKLVSKNGKVGENGESSEPKWIQHTVSIQQGVLSDTNIFTLQVANYCHARGGPVDSIILGDEDKLIGRRNLLFTLDAMLAGALIMGGMFFLGLYLYGRRQTSILYFSVICMVFSYYILATGNYVLIWLFQDIPWLISVKLEYISVYLLALLFIKYAYALYPHDGPKYAEKVTVVVCLAFIGCAILFSPLIFTSIQKYFLFFVIAIMGLVGYMYMRAVYMKRPGSEYTAISTSVIIVLLLAQVLHQLAFLEIPVFVMPVGYVIFFFLQSIATSHQVSLAWKKAKEQAEVSLRAKSDFLSTMSHEIRTPMNAVIGLTHHLIDSHPRNDQKKTLDILRFSSENLLRLINDILDYNKLESGKLIIEESVFNMKELGQNLVDGFKTTAEEMKTQVIFDYDKNLPLQYIGDAGRLTQVLSNLINNAIKFTKEGTVTLKISQGERSPASILIDFAVIDTGIGISKIDRRKIFEKFNQANTSINRQYGGTGLGLAITKKILELQGAEIHLESELGQGSRFYFSQDYTIAKGVRKQVTKPSVMKDPLLDKRILLVEDNEVNVMVASRFLEKWHCSVVVAKNGQEALEVYDEYGYDLILMDLQMPVMDGYTATRELRAMGATLPILALTAAALSDIDQNIKAAGLDDLVVKPFHPDHLYQKLIKHLVTEKVTP
ncbi:MAG: response regulator [Marinoscillum sp.]